MNSVRLILLFVFAAFASSRTAICGDELVLVSPHWEGVRREFQDAFALEWQAATGNTVTFRWLDVGGTSDIVRFLRSEFGAKPDGVGVDIMFGGGTDPFIDLAKDGILDSITLSEKELREIPAAIGGVPMYDSKGRWYAAGLATFGILTNRGVADWLKLPYPREWRELADPRYFGWIGLGDPRKSGSMHLMFEAILQAYGWDEGWRILYGAAANARHFSNHASQVGKEILTGEVGFGLVIDTYAGDLVRRAGRGMFTFTVPAGKSPVTGDAIALIKGAPHRPVADAFIRFVLSKKGQTLVFAKAGEPGGPVKYDIGKLPIIPSLYGAVAGASLVTENPFTWRFDFAYDAEMSGTRWAIVNDLIGVFLIDGQERLIAARREGADFTKLPPPLSVNELKVLIEGGEHKNIAGRSRLLNEWEAKSYVLFPANSSRVRTVLRLVPSLLALIAIVVFFWLKVHPQLFSGRHEQ